MKLVAYLRVSSAGQAENGQGLELQEQTIRGWAKANRHRLVAVHRDAGVSGAKDAVDRPGLTDALATIEQHQADGLLVSRLDRLARALTVQEAVLARVWQAGGVVYAVDHGEVRPDDPDDPMRTAMRQMIGVFAELDRRMTVQRLRDARLKKGGTAWGPAPFGTKDGERATVKRARALRKQGRSLREVAATLDAEGRAPRHGGRWHPATVARILK